ncbi:MAG: diaminopimelate decarboxylase [Proteobacteria bacterium]|nr:diaminopimelate decarboxylase [Pseudomonadota bacterium]MBU1450028.1 diaminopimelate decarboxylase [Pseudomonadota bacterium]MBU2470622.1 diaminopimelate decarboxylase [Pseudomonadota bacterium]MBU2516649.1 diaminopimelate decarboxylase [Pseudomonadota bacterium]
MHNFSYQNGELYAEDVPLATIAQQVGTPSYVYSQATLERHFKVFDQAFEDLDHLVCFAVKANSSQAVIATLAHLGAGADIVSGGELVRGMAAGVPADRIVYSGVGKSEAEMQAALEAGILMFNLESAQELVALNEVAGRMGLKAPVSLRVNPDVDAQTHPKITTGLSKNKFGLDVDLAFKQYQEAANLPNLQLKGVSCHIGSQLTKVDPFADALERLGVLIGRLRGAGIELELLDLGGGLGITYDQEEPPSPAQYAQALKEQAARLGLKLVLEPGRVIVGNAGILLCRVLFTKDTPTKHFVIVDAGMNDLVRPAMYDSYQAIWPVKQDGGGSKVISDVVGPICETGDFLARDRELPDLVRGELIAVMSAGAYGFSMASTYNSRPRVAEVMVSGGRWSVVRRRETVEELMRGERLPEWME